MRRQTLHVTAKPPNSPVLPYPLISPCQPDKRPQSSSIKNDVILSGRVCFMEQIFRTEKLPFP